MPLSDVEEILSKMKKSSLAGKPEFDLIPYPMFEELAHPETVAQMKLFRKYGMTNEAMATSRGRKYEQIRADYADVEKISSILAIYCSDDETAPDEKKFLSGIKANTEAELVKLALSLSDEERKKYKPGFMNGIWLVADQNFDLYTGKGNYLSARHGNMKKDNFSVIMEKALSDDPFSTLQSCFSRDISDIDITVLAEKYGDPEGQKVYLDGLNEIKNRWIDQAFADWRRY